MHQNIWSIQKTEVGHPQVMSTAEPRLTETTGSRALIKISEDFISWWQLIWPHLLITCSTISTEAISSQLNGWTLITTKLWPLTSNHFVLYVLFCFVLAARLVQFVWKTTCLLYIATHSKCLYPEFAEDMVRTFTSLNFLKALPWKAKSNVANKRKIKPLKETPRAI